MRAGSWREAASWRGRPARGRAGTEPASKRRAACEGKGRKGSLIAAGRGSCHVLLDGAWVVAECKGLHNVCYDNPSGAGWLHLGSGRQHVGV